MLQNEIVSEQITEMNEMAHNGELRCIIESEINSNLSQNYSDEIHDLADLNHTSFEEEKEDILNLVMQEHDNLF